MTSGVMPTIGCVFNDLRFSFWAILRHGARSRAAEAGIMLRDAAAGDTLEQGELIADMLRQRVQALVIGPAHDTEIFQAHLELARAARVPVIEVDGGIRAGPVSATVRADERHGLTNLADALVTHCGSAFRIGLIAGPQNRRAAVMAEVLAHYADVRVVATVTGEWTRESGRRCATALLAANGPIDALFAANDPMALGAIDAVAAAGLAGRVAVTGYDGLPEALRAIANGEMLATVDQEPLQIGSQAVDLALRAVRGETVERHVYTPGKLINRATVMATALNALDLLPGIMRDLLESNAARQQLQDEIIAVQRSTIRELSTPIIPIDDHTLIVPLIGAIDSARAAQMTQTILDAVGNHRADTVIIDITGIAVVDTSVANHLIQTARAAGLLGARVTLAGMTPEVAQTIVQLGVDLAHLSTRGTLRSALEATRRLRGHS